MASTAGFRVRGKQGPLVRRRAHGGGEFLTLGGHVGDVVADSPDTLRRDMCRELTRGCDKSQGLTQGRRNEDIQDRAGGVGSRTVVTVRPGGISAVGGCASRG